MGPSLKIPDIVYEGQGKCIICLRDFTPGSKGRDVPSVEHIIPEALCKSGQMRIRNGTCKGCNDNANQRFEQPTLKGDLNTVRVLFDLKRKKRSSKQRQPRNLPPVAVGDSAVGGGAFDTMLTAEEYPNIVTLFKMEPAGKLIGVEKSGDLTEFRQQDFFIGPKPRERLDVTTREYGDHTAFSLTIAKIAYCYAAAKLGIEAFDGDEIRALLRGERDDVYNFVGGIVKPQHLTDRFLHSLYIKDRDELLTVVVHLFASCKMSPYEVVVGRRV